MVKEIRAVIIEDMHEYLDIVQLLLHEVAPWVKIIGKAQTLELAEQIILEQSPDVIFLDIQFENSGKTGFDLLDSIRSKNRLNFQVIIISAHFEIQYYAKAFEYSAVHFIEKPINKNKLLEAVLRAKDLSISKKINELESLIEQVSDINKTEPSKPAKLDTMGCRFNELIDVTDIIWIEADGRISYIYLCNDKRISSMDNIGTLERKLSSYGHFFRINRSEIVNINYIEKYSKKVRLVVLKGKVQNHYVSKDKIKEFISKISES